MRTASLAALWLSLAMPVLALMGCSNGNTRMADTPVAADTYRQPQPWWAKRPAPVYGQGQHIGALDDGRKCVPSTELAVEIVYGELEGVAETAEGKCSVYRPGARFIEYSVAVSNPGQCTPEGLKAFGVNLPLKPPVCG